MKKYILFCLCSVVTLSCKETPPEPSKQPTLSLNAEDASCTEAWLKVSCTELPATIRLQILTPTTQTKQTIRLTTTDTLLIDEGLLPNRTYTYQLQRLNADSTFAETSSSVQVTTMDATSHNFTWSIDTLGVTSSVLNDVAIISDNNVWAVGEIFLNDSSGHLDPRRYNAAHWDGNTWTILRVPYYYQGQPFHHPIQSVYALSENDVWFAGNGVVRWNGQQYLPIEIPSSVWGPNRINKIWGSTNNLYIVGDGGSIAHYANGTWQRVESGTTLPIMDVHGTRDPKSGLYEILCVAADPAPWGRSQILAMEDIRVREVAILPWEQWCLWFVSGRHYFAGGGDGLWQAYSVNGTWVRDSELPALFKESLGGQGLNDIVVCGSFWLLGHYNGVSWQTFFPRTSGSLGGVDIKGDIIVAVGFIDNRAAAIRGRR